MLVLDERNQVHVVLALDDEDALAGVTVGIRVLQDVEQIAKNFRRWKTVWTLPSTPITISSKKKRGTKKSCRCANLIVSTEGFTPRECARQCAQPRSNHGHSGANANQRSNKKRA